MACRRHALAHTRVTCVLHRIRHLSALHAEEDACDVPLIPPTQPAECLTARRQEAACKQDSEIASKALASLQRQEEHASQVLLPRTTVALCMSLA